MENVAKEVVSVKFQSRRYYATLENGRTVEITRKQYFFIISKSEDGYDVFYDGENVTFNQSNEVMTCQL